MIWPLRRPRRETPDVERDRRIVTLQEHIEQQKYLSEQAVHGAKRVAERSTETRQRATDTQDRNHYAEGLAAFAYAVRARPRRQRRWGRT